VFSSWGGLPGSRKMLARNGANKSGNAVEN